MDTNALPPLLLQFAATVVLSFVLGLELHSYRRAQDEGIGFGTTRTLTLIAAQAPAATAKFAPHNPLDLPVAFLFAGLFVAFAALTAFITQHFGVTGLHVPSFLVGFTDIDPFVLSLLAGHFQLSETAVATAILIASGSNNLLKAGCAIALSRQRAMPPAAAWLALTLAVSALWTMWLWQRQSA